MTLFTADNTIIAAAENFCICEEQAGREPVFTPLQVGRFSTWRQRRLFESSMTAWQTRGTELHAQAVQNVTKFRFENYSEA